MYISYFVLFIIYVYIHTHIHTYYMYIYVYAYMKYYKDQHTENYDFKRASDQALDDGYIMDVSRLFSNHGYLLK